MISISVGESWVCFSKWGQVASLNFYVKRLVNAYKGNDGEWIGILLFCNLNYVRAAWLFGV